MKLQKSIDWTLFAGIAALVLAVPLAAGAANQLGPAQAVSPCTYTGRLMDAEHVGFDSNRVAKISAYDASRNLVATSKTFFKADTRRNYALRIPMASKAVDGSPAPDSTVTIEVTEPNGTVWTGLVVDQDAKLGAPGTLKEVDIVLARCTNQYGIDDNLLDDLRWAWEDSPYGQLRATFNPRDDHDGDGMSTLAEALAGTNPFDPEDSLKILSFRRGVKDGVEVDTLSFEGRPGRAYALEVTESLGNPEWKSKGFTVNESGTPVNYISVPATAKGVETPTVYLLPETGKSAFFRVKSE